MKHKLAKIQKVAGVFLALLLQLVALLIGCYSITGACFSMLLIEVDWSIMGPAIGCLSILFWLVFRTKPSFYTRISTVLLAICYAMLCIGNASSMAEGLQAGLQGIFQHLNQLYQIHLPLLAETEWVTRGIHLELFAVVFPLAAFGAYGILRRRSGLLALLYGVALITACLLQVFPDDIYLLGMLLSLSSSVAGPVLDEKWTLSRKVAFISMLFCGLMFVVAKRYLVPPIDRVYEQLQGNRSNLYQTVNEEWIPAVESRFNWKALFRDSTVGGNLEEDGVYYTSAKLYQITLQEAPREVLYLKGFVGDVYTGSEWHALGDEALESYYGERGWTLPDYAQIVNWTWELARTQWAAKQVMQGVRNPGQEEDAQIRIEEIGGRNVYSLYPYGSRLEGGVVHADGSQEWQDRVCSYEYQPLWDFDGKMPVGLGAETTRRRELYREYVYDTYLEVPREQIPGVISWVEEQDFPYYNGVNLWQVTSSTLRALEREADYHLAEQAVLEGEDYVEAFLLRRKEGYCSHFASAEVLILRLLGVPARYVAGYCASPQDFQETEEGYQTEVLDKQAHAWVEIYVDALGWVPLEATPGAVALSYDNRMELVSRVAQMDGGNMAMDRQEEILEELEEAETESAAESEELREELAPEEETPPEDPEEAAALEAPGAGQGDTGYEWVESIIEIAAAVGLLLAAAFGLIKLRHWLWRRKLERTSRRVRILLLYCKMLEMLKMLNEQERPWSLIELEEVDAGQAAELITETVVGLNTEQVQTFLELAEEESFGKRVVSADEYDSSLAMLREMYARLQAAFPWYLKFLLWVNCGAIL